MELEYIDGYCLNKQKELINKYFGDTSHIIAYDKPESIPPYFSVELPLKVEDEYYAFLKNLWEQSNPTPSISIDDLLDKRHEYMVSTKEVRVMLKHAHDDAKRVTLWEKLTKSNYEDVGIYIALLKEYTEELLECLRFDFVEDVSEHAESFSLRVRNLDGGKL